MKYLISFLFLALAFSMKSEAKVTLPSILGDNMVLQQQAEVKLWGKARPNATVTVKTSWNGQTYKSSSDGKGGWSLTVSTPVAGGPYKIIFNDGELLTLQNVLIGEVWFCSGQSNMEMPMGGFDRQPVRGTNDIIAKAKPSTPIRMYTTDSKDGRWVRQFSKTPVEDCQGEWLENTPVKRFSYQCCVLLLCALHTGSAGSSGRHRRFYVGRIKSRGMDEQRIYKAF